MPGYEEIWEDRVTLRSYSGSIYQAIVRTYWIRKGDVVVRSHSTTTIVE